MGKLKILPAQVANMIAAGEVVQRPASVVKELMENAVDAGASQISVVVTDAGRTLLQVIDNGCGMSPVDAVLCFERHATSKIATAEDLEQILTYGFRGEALASIAAVAEVTLRTRRPQDETGTEVRVGAFGEVKTATVAAPVGSNFAVRNLFYNTPARRKFLKSDNIELKHAIEEFSRIALIRPDVEFTLSHNGRDLFVLKKVKALKFRVMDLLGTNAASDLLELSADTSLVRISGFIGQPSAARKTAAGQYMFVNGRYFRSGYLHKAVMNAYEDFLPEGLTPPYIVMLEVDPHSVDVNISPTKTEVKFEEEAVLFQSVYACVKEALGHSAFGPSIDFDADAQVQMPVFGSSFDEIHPDTAAPDTGFDPAYNPFDNPRGTEAHGTYAGGYGASGAVDRNENYGALFENRDLPSAQVLVIQGKYILAPSRSGVMIVNIRRARERILYEQFLSAFSDGAHVAQQALFPVQVRVGTQMRLLLDEHAEMLGRLGFDITPFGGDTIVVNGVPEGYSCEAGKVETMVEDLLRILSDDEASALPEMMAQNMARKFAVLGASGALPPTGAAEARKLLDTLLSTSNSEFTSSGHRIISVLDADEMEKRFK